MNNFFLKTEGRSPSDESPRGKHGRQVAAWLISPLVALGLSLSSHAEITEPDTIFYGKVVNRSSHQDYLVTQGALAWAIQRPDGKQINITTTLLPLNGGAYCYQLRVPHETLTFGLTVSSNSVPLTVLPGTCSHLQVTVDGLPATIMAPASSTFVVSQALRASTYRLDLELLNPLADTSGDGIPDWWKSKYGAIDPNADPDQDGWSNLQEFLHGANPTNDNRIASLSTGELFV